MILTVTNRAPVLALLTPVRDQTFAPLAAVALHATIVDQGTNDTETCSIDWGDGTTSIGVVSPAALAGQWFCDGSHGFAGDLTAFNVRAFTIKVAATDDDNGTDTRNVSVKVDPCTWTGTAGNDVHDGTPGDDILCGLGGNDTLNGLGGNDILVGQGGNDILNGGAGNDRFIGGAGTDTATFAGGPAVTASLAASSASGWGSDTFDSDVENLTGSSNGDILTGDGGVNVIDGGAGDDILDGRAGNDALIGGPGNDTVTFADAPAAVGVNLLAGTGTGWGTDGLTTIENVIGSANNDSLVGNGAVNRLDGAAGNDTLDGQAGNDDLIGGPGDGDTVTYSASPSAVVVRSSSGRGSVGGPTTSPPSRTSSAPPATTRWSARTARTSSRASAATTS